MGDIKPDVTEERRNPPYRNKMRLVQDATNLF